MSGLFSVALRNFVRNRRRYRVLLVAFSLVVAILVVLLGTISGMQSTLRQKATLYFAGDITVLGYLSSESRIEAPQRMEELVRSAGVDIRALTVRSTFYDQNNANLFHAGFFTRQRRLLGVDWEREAETFQGFDFVAGGIPGPGDIDAVVISTAAAEAIHASLGDRIIVSSTTDRGRENTVELVVRGIYRESSFFGFATYLDRRTLNILLERSEEHVNEIGVYLRNPARDESVAAARITEAIAEHYPTFEVITNRDALAAETVRPRTKRHYGVVTLGAQLAEINDLLFAMTAIAGVIIIMFLSITMIGVANTYSMITFERTREIGTLRALGMQARGVVFVFVSEAVVLAFTGLAAGMAAGFAVLVFVSDQLAFPPGGVADLFLTGGRLQWQLPLSGLAAIAVLTVGAGVLGSLRASVRAGRIPPVDALRQ